jgi:hypothetical protein
MCRDVDAPARLVDAEATQRARHRRLLRAHRHLERPVWRAHPRRGYQRRQPEVVVAKQRLVAALALLRNAIAVGARELDVALQRRRERREVVVCTRLLPDLLAVGARPRQLHGELFRHPARPLPVAARKAHDVAVELVQGRPADRSRPIARRVDLRQPLSDLRGGGLLVGEASERPELLPARRAALAGHHHQLVPVGEHPNRGEIRQLGHAGAQLLHRVHC